MSILQAILLGIIQGITEFLPISSTAHLTITGKLLGIVGSTAPEDWTAFIAIMQLGTMTAVVIYFFKDLYSMAGAVISDLKGKPPGSKRNWSGQSRIAGQIIIGTLPVAVVGLAFKKIIEGTFTKEISTIASSLIVLALLLLWAEKVGKHLRTQNQTTWKDGLIVGIAQACALIPGSSRSGTTITAGLFLGLSRETAARFSFLLSIPAVIASGLYEMYEARHHMPDLGITPLVVSTIVSCIVGYGAIAFLLKYLRTRTTYPFIYYRILLGTLLWVLLLAKVSW